MLRWDGPPAFASHSCRQRQRADLQSAAQQPPLWGQVQISGVWAICLFGKGQSKCAFSAAGEREGLGRELRERLVRRLL